MNSFEMKNKLAGVLGDDKAEELITYIDERTGREYGEERASINASLQEIMRRLDRLENRMDSLQQGQVRLIQWMVGVGLTVIGLTVTLVKFL